MTILPFAVSSYKARRAHKLSPWLAGGLLLTAFVYIHGRPLIHYHGAAVRQIFVGETLLGGGACAFGSWLAGKHRAEAVEPDRQSDI